MIGAAVTDGSRDIMLMGSAGKMIRFKEGDVRAMGRTARGVRGIKLPEGHHVVSLILPEEDGLLLVASENGYGKRTRLDEFSVINRGGQGVIAMQVSERNGSLVGAVQVFEGDELMLISDRGTLVRTRTSEVSVLGRNTQGVRLINLTQAGERLVGVERIEEPEEEELPGGELAEGEVLEGASESESVIGAEGSSQAEGSNDEQDSDGETLQ